MWMRKKRDRIMFVYVLILNAFYLPAMFYSMFQMVMFFSTRSYLEDTLFAYMQWYIYQIKKHAFSSLWLIDIILLMLLLLPQCYTSWSPLPCHFLYTHTKDGSIGQSVNNLQRFVFLHMIEISNFNHVLTNFQEWRTEKGIFRSTEKPLLNSVYSIGRNWIQTNLDSGPKV